MKYINERRQAALRKAALLACVALASLAAGIQVYAATPFSFVAIGDTRTEPYLTGGMEQAQAMEKVLKERYHDNPVRLFFDSTGLELTRAEIQEQSALLTLYYRDGWPRTIVKLANGRARVLMRDMGRKWVCNRIVSAVNRGASDPANGALFVIHGGDIPVFGYQGATLDESPYWQLFDDELLSRLPPPGKNLGLPGRVLAAVGNHETWHDEKISGLLTAMPWLKALGLSDKRRIYAVRFRNCRFIFLDAGGYKTGSYGEAWTSDYPGFDAQMAFLKKELKAAKETGADHVFIVYHKPSFVKVGHDPLIMDQNPHKFIKEFAKDLNIVVFNSHSHSTEHYLVDGVHYLVLGAGGAPQAFDLNANPSPESELYWKGQNRVEEYNYLQVFVDGPKIKGTIHRFRPTDALKPFSVMEVFKIK
ncbi:MAG: metallophosphoesterase [Desulfobacterales bacterium]|jgi:hypothetical protein